MRSADGLKRGRAQGRTAARRLGSIPRGKACGRDGGKGPIWALWPAGRLSKRNRRYAAALSAKISSLHEAFCTAPGQALFVDPARHEVPSRAQQRGPAGERRSGGMSEHLPPGGCERYVACDAARQRVLGCQSMHLSGAGIELYAPLTDAGVGKGGVPLFSPSFGYFSWRSKKSTNIWGPRPGPTTWAGWGKAERRNE